MGESCLSLLVLAALLASLTGCGDRSPTEETAPSQSPVEIEEEMTTSAPAETGQPQETEGVGAAQAGFDTIQIEVERGTMRIQSGEEFSYCRKNGDHAAYEIADGVLTISQTESHETVLTLPEGQYTELDITVGEGRLYAESPLLMEKLTLYISRGEAALDGVTVEKSSQVEAVQGSASLSGDLGVEISVRSDMGHVSMGLTRPKGDYHISLSLSEGDIQVGHDNYHDRRLTKELNSDGACSMELTCTRGNISVGFSD